MENARRHTRPVLLQLLPQRHIPRIIVITVVVTTVNVVYMANVNTVTDILNIPGRNLYIMQLNYPGLGLRSLEVNHFYFHSMLK